MAFQGIDVRQTSDRLLFRSLLQDSAGAVLTSGTTSLRLYELQNDGTLKSYDFNDNTFKTTALTTNTLSMTHRQGNNSTYNTGIWTVGLTTLTGFTAGSIYFAHVSNTGASPAVQVREFQFGGAQGDLVVTSTRLEVDVKAVGGSTQSLTDLKDFADTGYDPATHKVEGVKTADALTANNDKTGYALTSAYDAAKTAAQAGDAMTLTVGERTAIANEVEAQIIDETDSEKVLTAITNKIASVNPSLADLTLAAIAAQVRTELALELGRIDVAISSRLASAGYTAPPSASSNATAVRAELAIELARLDASISSRATAVDAGSAARDAVFAQVIEGAITFIETVRALFAGVGTNVEISGNTVKLKSADGAKDRVTATTTEEGVRTVTGRDLA